MHLTRLLAVIVLLQTLRADAATHAFAQRGYYMTFMRMPTFGLPQWRQMIDCMKEDDANTLILWTAGAFRSKRFPITWKYNADHENVRRDFVPELISYAHERQIKVLLGFTPFAYDGVNQFTLDHPELKATQKNGSPANLWGMHSWGYNLCPSRPGSQRFMHDYAHEMFFEFYPGADGLLIESSDYAICYCADCREKFFDHEFAFVRQISDEIWRAKSNATIMVYPSYFNGRPVPGFGVAGAKQKFDSRWTLFFTPHSAHIDDELMKQARGSVYSDSGLTLGTPTRIGEAARLAQSRSVTGYIPSCEPFSCIDGPPGAPKPRQKPFHFDWLADGVMPLNELLIRVNRLAFREYTRNPKLGDEAFQEILRTELFGPDSEPASVQDLLFVQGCWFNGADWFTPAPLLRPADLKARAQREQWPASKIRGFEQSVDRLRAIAGRYRDTNNTNRRELSRLANSIVRAWDSQAPVSHLGK